MAIVIYAIPFLASVVSGALLFAFPLNVTEATGDSFLSGLVVLVSGSTYVVTTAILMITKPSDRTSLRIVYGGLTALLLAALLPIFWWQPWWLTYVYTTLQGVGSAAFLVCFQIVLRKVASRYSIPVSFSNFIVSWALGYAIGPFISGLFHSGSIIIPLVFAASCTIFALVLLAVVMRIKVASTVVAAAQPLPVNEGTIRFGWGLIFLSGFFMVTIRGIFPDYGSVQGFSASQSGSMLLLLFIALTITAFLLRYLYPNFIRHRNTFWLVPAGYIIACALLMTGNAISGFFGVVFLGFSIAVGYFFAGSYALSDEPNKSKNVAINETIVGVASILGPFAASTLAQNFGYAAFFAISAIIAVIVFSIAELFAYRARN